MKAFLFILLVLLCLSCKQNTRSQSVTIPENNPVRADSIFHPRGMLQSIEYSNHPQGIRSKNFSILDGSLSSIRWEHDNPQRGDTIAIGFFGNGNIRRISFYRDRNNSFPGDTIEISYFESGKLSELTTIDYNNQLRSKRFSSNGNLSSISWEQDNHNLRQRGDTLAIHFFPNGNLRGINFYRSEDNARRGDTIRINYFESGKPSVVVTLADDWFPFPQLQTFFFECGQIRMQGITDSFNITALPVGLWEEFDSSGTLVRTVYYHPDMDGNDFIIVEEFSEGRLVSRRKYNNYVQHESDPILIEQLY